MRYIWQHTRSVIDTYNGGIPLAHFLKNYFRLYKQLGSRDRKIISEMVYCWYRFAKALPEELPFEEKIKYCLFVCETTNAPALRFLPEEWLEKKQENLVERLAMLKQYSNWDLSKIASFSPHFSKGIAKEEWLLSMLQQPRLFIRVRQQKEKIRKILGEQNIQYTELNETCFSLPNGTPVDKLLPQEWYVVQDAASQQTGNFFHSQNNKSWWDCCAGAGGKSLLLKDLQPDARLLVSDKRSTILHNLSERFRAYQHAQPEIIIADVSDDKTLKESLGSRQFDNIICDVPCTGSGTWARTPEQLYFFEEKMIGEFNSKQKQIAANALSFLKPGGTLYYITCSVFAAENEAVVESLTESKKADRLDSTLINGIAEHSDSMYMASLVK